VDSFMSSEVLTMVNIKIALSWDMVSCSSVDRY
jgi:hypothetical protein